MANRLTVKTIESVGAVDAGDNPEARMMFWKRADKSDPLEGPDEGSRDTMGEFSLADLSLSDEQAEQLDTFIAAEVAKAVEAVTVAPEPEPADVLKSAPDEVQELVAELQKRADENAAALAAEIAKRESAEFVAKAEPYRALIGDPVETGPVLQRIAAAAPDEAAALFGWLDALVGRDELAGLFKSFGESDAGDPLAGKDEWVRKYRAEHGVSEAAARAEFWRQNEGAIEASREK